MSDILIQVKRTTVSGRTPNTTNIANSQYITDGELAINLPDGRLFSSNGSALIEVGANLTILNVVGGATVNGALTVNNISSVGNTTITGFANISSELKAGSNTLFANSTVVKVTVNDTLTFADNTTQNTAFRVYNESGTRIA